MLDLKDTPYLLDEAIARPIGAALTSLRERVDVLRASGKLRPETLADYYGETRFAQIAESNAIEGSTLTVGETELAVTKGITVTGHDPGYSRDARTLAAAHDRLVEMARSPGPTTNAELKEIHELLLGERPSAGHFRNEEVRISGSAHKPPRTWREVMAAMEQWEAWSKENASAPPALRAAVLHAWLVHIHPFIDGNGRAGRAIGNLELIRAGYPPLIIRARKDRSRYLEALARSDEGDLSLFLDLIVDRAGDALRDLERAAVRRQGYDKAAQMLRMAQQRQLAVWSAAVELLVQMTHARLHERLTAVGGSAEVYSYRDTLDLDDYLALCQGNAISRAWTFRIQATAPGLPEVTRLAWAGFRSPKTLGSLPKAAAATPSLLWSEPNPDRYPPWRRLEQGGPGGDELTLVGDRWLCLVGGRGLERSPGELADAVADGVLRTMAGET